MRLPERYRWLLWLSLAEIGTMLVFNNYAALLPILQKEWSLTNSQAGWIYSSYQIGYLLAVVLLTSLTDYVPTPYIYILSSFWAGGAGMLFAFWAEGFNSALILRTLMGIGFAGTYMPGLRMVSERFGPFERGRAVGIYVGTFTLGAAISLFVTGTLYSLYSWRWAFFLTSLGPMLGGFLALFTFGKGAAAKGEEGRRMPLREILNHRPALRMIGGYAAHMWEMFGMRGWIVAFLTACLLTDQGGIEKATSLSAVIASFVTLAGALSNAIGGALSDRFGRVPTIIVVMVGSSLLSLSIGWMRGAPLPWIVGLSILYGFLVTGESSVLSTGITELAPRGGLGRTLALQSFLGWTAASLSPIAFGFVLDLTNPAEAAVRTGYVANWGWAFMVLGLGAMIGPFLLWPLKQKPLDR
ncbi:MAG: MFS transporter [Desulfobacterota bacterium]|nr:MFS transporter [Thermodesulfobacteriota bacterium]